MNIVTFLETLVNNILDAEDKFFSDPSDLHGLESSLTASANELVTDLIGGILSETDKIIRDLPWRKNHYNIQRRDQRTLISSAGEVTFDCTYYQNRDSGSGYRYLLEDIIGIDKHERFTEDAEVTILKEALRTSYHGATEALPAKSRITATTVMNKIHRIAEELPTDKPEGPKKELPYLFIEADEDHISEQHGRWRSPSENKGFISRLAYLYEYREESGTEKGRWKLVNPFYFGGLYQGSEGMERFWRNIEEYIEDHYDIDKLESVFISGDGAYWIRSGASWIPRGLYCADKFHLVKYINAAANQMLDENEIAKKELYRLLQTKDREGFDGYTAMMYSAAEKKEAVGDLRSYVLGSWDAVMRTLHNRKIYGCSAEGHVSHIVSARMNSRPMGWSQTGADRMSKLRCYVKNYGSDRIIDLVRYSRSLGKFRSIPEEGVCIPHMTQREIRAEHYNQARSYIDRLQARMPGITSRKSVSIMVRCWSL